ncbi:MULTISPECIES: arsenate reductase ArsC [unclassified Lysobacter]|uniref:arsenate reductase ArsC n=1 Tax=unclassified Lysobacter TaxID=2635362 RepID=UPI001BEB5379|nr:MULTISPECIES: arsenate reductase ArsC [unclassified Lysobacter]MBT2748737.1 arsenate reductase ArsC [Lysobacter sp. ISL-42]MBT2751672.1 arsenate reductase ArsC [Lysobacter sp. ISL-50]MBT2775866.1 arsenate reductase ArsC [Lysobacter sp. ISL-54]MBT2782170.1 arsenate reductase ArsC [Lysobacter sp. ISL-52]
MNGQYNVLFLCTGNSARSIIAEAVANQLGKGRITAYSAGSQPRGGVHPVAIEVLNKAGLPTAELRSKAWDEFAKPGAPEMDLVITVCDRAAGESCPIWPGQPATAHWGIEDPADAMGSPEHIQKAFTNVMLLLQHRISLLLALKVEALDRLVMQTAARKIGKD